METSILADISLDYSQPVERRVRGKSRQDAQVNDEESRFAWINIHKDPTKEINSPRHRAVISRQATMSSRRYPNGVLRPNLATHQVAPSPDRHVRRRRQGKKSTAHDGDEGDSRTLVHMTSTSPVMALSQASTDPFESLSTNMSKERWRRLDLWLNASNVMPWEDGECRSEVAKVRKQVASPYALGSEATLSATLLLIAYDTEITLGWSGLAPQLSVALPALKRAVTTLTASSAADVCLAMHLHMTVAWHLRELTSFEAHFGGLCSLIARYPTLYTRNTNICGLLTLWSFVHARGPGQHTLPEDFENGCLEQDSSVPAIAADLGRRGLLSKKMITGIHRLDIVCRLQRKLFAQSISAQEVSQYFRCLWSHLHYTHVGMPDQCLSNLDQIMVFVFHIHTGYGSGGLLNPFLMSRIVRSVLNRLARYNLTWLLNNYPEVILWIGMTAGTVATGTAKLQFIALIKGALRKLFVSDLEAATSICADILWGMLQDAAAAKLWDVAFESRTSTIPKSPSAATQVMMRRDITVCVFCDIEECTCPLRRSARTGIDFAVPVPCRSVLFVTKPAEIRMLCMGSSSDWYKVDADFDLEGSFPATLDD